MVPVLAIRRAGYTWDDLLLGWRATPGSVSRLVALFAAGFFLNAAKLGPVEDAIRSLPPIEAVLRVAFGWGVILFCAALPEEIVYRWGLQTRLELAWGRLAAILVTAVVFTAWHLPPRYFLASGAEGTAGDLGSVLLAPEFPCSWSPSFSDGRGTGGAISLRSSRSIGASTRCRRSRRTSRSRSGGTEMCRALLSILLACACAADDPARTAERAAAGSTVADVARPGAAATPSVEFLANEGVILWDGERGVAIDALFGDGLPEYPTVAPATRDSLERSLGRFGGIELVLVTHVHRDHFDAAAVGRHLFANPRARLVAPAQVVDSLTAKVPGAAALQGRIHAMDLPPGATFELDLTVHALGIAHPPSRNQPVEHATYLVRVGGARVIHLGDSRPGPTDLTPFLEHGGPELLLAPWWILEGDEGARLLAVIGANRVAGFHLGRDGLDDPPRVAPGVVLFDAPRVSQIHFPER